ncbi:16S rRNA (adenine(1518)-N(6)/adenine(1519)-N(6))-dimethyltransferase RsmA [bacterium]|nr:16S rRNA (adenine(1518)-N(6)/adenine(1519)-N(6))-dimethyltransferase RsmA [bacterium]MCI0565824.1 16S rRNA (adenine(1518)-N(6)/adenine(1519)-N(6))-dimethyltransferase RsmA [bacterium]MCI0679736.1 16S rRNA (adenine(1518)-N(6)/adenine(1519)-N(6))-dimethyltransferase RsmA [bacterium]
MKHKAKKSLGQHFLTSPAIAESIVRAGEVTGRDIVLEIGPGTGILTRELLSQAKRVVAVEKDDRLYEELGEIFKNDIRKKRLTLMHGDILSFDLLSSNLKPGAYILAGNIPYNITGRIIRRFFNRERLPKHVCLMVQKEVAERILAKNGKESILSISVKAFGEPHYARTVLRGSFNPPPRVDSAVIAVRHISSNNFEKISEDIFFDLVRKGFSHKRKLLIGNLSGSSREKKHWEGAFAACGVEGNARAENLETKDWFCLAGVANYPQAE